MHHTTEFEKERLRFFLNISRAYILEPLGEKKIRSIGCVCVCMYAHMHIYTHIYTYI